MASPVYSRDDDKLIHGLVSPSSISPSNTDAARRGYQVFVSSALGKLKGFRTVEEREANYGPFALSVIAFGIMSLVLAGSAASALPSPLRRTPVTRELLPWLNLAVGIAGIFAAYSSWISRWASYSLTTTRRIAISVIIVSACAVLLVEASREAAPTAGNAPLTQRQLHMILHAGVSAAGIAVLFANRGRLSRLATTIRDNSGGAAATP